MHVASPLLSYKYFVCSVGDLAFSRECDINFVWSQEELKCVRRQKLVAASKQEVKETLVVETPHYSAQKQDLTIVTSPIVAATNAPQSMDKSFYSKIEIDQLFKSFYENALKQPQLPSMPMVSTYDSPVIESYTHKPVQHVYSQPQVQPYIQSVSPAYYQPAVNAPVINTYDQMRTASSYNQLEMELFKNVISSIQNKYKRQ